MSERSLDDIRATGAAWITEAELERVIALASNNERRTVLFGLILFGIGVVLGWLAL